MPLALLGLLLWLPGVLSLPPLDATKAAFAKPPPDGGVGRCGGHPLRPCPRYKKPPGFTAAGRGYRNCGPILRNEGQDNRIGPIACVAARRHRRRLADGVVCACRGRGERRCWRHLDAGQRVADGGSTTPPRRVLLACVPGRAGVLLRLYRAARDSEARILGSFGPRTKTVMWGWAAVGFGILVKFPVVPGVAMATLIGLTAMGLVGAPQSRARRS